MRQLKEDVATRVSLAGFGSWAILFLETFFWREWESREWNVVLLDGLPENAKTAQSIHVILWSFSSSVIP